MHSELGRLVGSSKEQFWSTGRKDKRRVTRGNERCDGGPRTDSGMADPDCQNGFGALPRPSIVCSLLLARNAFCLSAADPSAFGLPFAKHNTPSLPPSLRPVRCRPKEEARKFANFLGWGARLRAGQPAMTFADGIGNLSSRKKEPTHAFDEQRTTEFAPCRP